MLPVVAPAPAAGTTDGLPSRHYVIVRAGLPLGLGMAMVCHAAGESGALKAPPPDTHAVVLSSPKDELIRLANKLTQENIKHVKVFEDAPPYAGELLALGVVPCEPVAKWLKHLPLWRHKCEATKP